ncbi:MAG: nucleotidyltransferase family protein [Candidatus Paceibacterota bacterium]
MRFWEKSEQGLKLKKEKKAVLFEIKKISKSEPLVFGSVALGLAHELSDIDIYLPEMHNQPDELEYTREKLEEILKYPVDLVSDLGTPESIRKNILYSAKSIKKM